jgi:methylated-DNA-[protein]-cysteine S-methyltransferase
MTQQHTGGQAAGNAALEHAGATYSPSSGQPARLLLDRIATPIGTALLVCDEAGILRALDFEDYRSRMLRLLRVHYGSMPLPEAPAPAGLRSSLLRYFEGQLDALRGIAWATAGTPFQRSVWNALVAIAPGHTMSYGELARSLGMPDAARAVGWANGSNPVAIVVPCHRVIGTSGKLTGYAGGLHRKDWLLRHEGARFMEAANGDLFNTVTVPAQRGDAHVSTGSPVPR